MNTVLSEKKQIQKKQILPLRYQLYSPIHHILTLLQDWKFLEKHPSIIIRNYLNHFMFNHIFLERKEYVVETKDEFLIQVPLNDQAAASIIFQKQYSPRQSLVLSHLLKYCSAFLDIGANLGYFSLLALRKTDDKYPVIAIEPNKKLCHLIQKSMSLNCFNRGQVIQAAMSHACGKGYLILDDNLSSNSQIVEDNNEEINQEPVEILTVDQLVKNLNLNFDNLLIKVDVEGFEINVLEGSKTVIKQGAIFMLEISHHLIDSLTKILVAHDYSCIDLFGKHVDIGKLKNHRKNDVVLVPSNLLGLITSLLQNLG